MSLLTICLKYFSASLKPVFLSAISQLRRLSLVFILNDVGICRTYSVGHGQMDVTWGDVQFYVFAECHGYSREVHFKAYACSSAAKQPRGIF